MKLLFALMAALFFVGMQHGRKIVFLVVTILFIWCQLENRNLHRCVRC